MDPVTIAALIAAGVALYGGWRSNKQAKENLNAQKRQNELDRQTAMERYKLERQDELTNWKLQNEFNSPEAQMNRLKQAGLSPSLVYGKGADNTADSIGSVSYNLQSQKAPELNVDNSWMQALGGVGSAYLRDRSIQAQTDNVAAQTLVNKQQELLTAAKTAETLQETARSKFALNQAQQLNDSVLKRASLENTKTEFEIGKIGADTQFTLDANERAKIAQGYDIKKLSEEILHSRTQRLVMEMEMSNNELKRKEIQARIKQMQSSVDSDQFQRELQRVQKDLADRNINPSDPWYIRKIEELMDGILNGNPRTYDPWDNTHNKR